MASLPQLHGFGGDLAAPEALPQKSPRSLILEGKGPAANHPHESPRAQALAVEDALAAGAAVGQFLPALSGPNRQILLLRWDGAEKVRGNLYDSPDEMLADSGDARTLERIAPRAREEFASYSVGTEALVLVLDSMTPCPEEGGAPFVGLFRYPLSRAVPPGK